MNPTFRRRVKELEDQMNTNKQKKHTIGECMSKALTWEDLGDIYKKETGRSAKTMSFDTVFNWASRQTDKFFVCPTEGTIHLKTNNLPNVPSEEG